MYREPLRTSVWGEGDMAERVAVSVTVNGAAYRREVEPRDLLVYFLREDLGLTGTHVGCDTSQCGACTVLLDDQPDQVVHAVRRSGGRAPPDHHRGHGNRRPVASDPAGVLERARPAVRFLHPRLHHDHRGPAGVEPEAERRGDSEGPRGQPVSLHGLREHRQSRANGQRIDRGRCCAFPSPLAEETRPWPFHR